MLTVTWTDSPSLESMVIVAVYCPCASPAVFTVTLIICTGSPGLIVPAVRSKDNQDEPSVCAVQFSCCPPLFPTYNGRVAVLPVTAPKSRTLGLIVRRQVHVTVMLCGWAVPEAVKVKVPF